MKVCLFVGGPLDGERRGVNLDHHSIRVAVPGGRLKAVEVDETETVEIESVWYVQARYHLGGGVGTVVYVPESMPQGDIDRRMAGHIIQALGVDVL